MRGLGLGLGMSRSVPYGNPSPGAALWLDATTPATVTTVSGACSALADRSGNGRNFAQATAGARPAYNASGFGPRSTPYLAFNGTSQFLSSVASVGALACASWTMFAVYAITSFPGQELIVSNRDYATPAGGTEISLGLNNQETFLFQDLATPNFLRGTAPATLGSPMIATAVVAAGAPNVRAIYTNGAADGSDHPDVTAVYLDVGRLGYEAAVGEFFLGSIAELIAYPTALSAAAIQWTHRYLGRKYGIAVP